MNEEPNNKCKELGIFHAWRKIENNFVYATYPPSYPPQQDECINCGLVRTHNVEEKKWFTYNIK